MTTARIETLAHRAFLTLPLAIVIISATLYPYMTEFWEVLRNAALAFYVFAFVFLKTATFETNGAVTKVVFSLNSWAIGIGLTFASFILATGLNMLFDIQLLLRLIS